MASEGQAAVVSQDVIARTAHEIREHNRSSGIRAAAEIGRIVLARFYDGRPELWRSHRPDKDTSLRKLAQSLRGTLTQSALRRCIRIHLVALEHPSLVQSAHLTTSHADEVYGLPPVQRELLLTSAEREGWNVVALRQAKRKLIEESVRSPRPSPGRPVSPPEFKAVTRLENALAAVQVAEGLLDEVAELHPAARQALLDVASKLKARADSVARRLDLAEVRPLDRVPELERLAKTPTEPIAKLRARAAG